MNCRICGQDNLIIEELQDVKSDVNRYYSEPTRLKKIKLHFGFCPKCSFGQIEYVLDDSFYEDYTMMHINTSKEGLDRGVSTYNEPYYRELLKHLSDMTGGEMYLDIGCGPGTLMGYAQNYFNIVRGVEPSREACDTGRRDGLDIVCGYFDENWSETGYSVITATQVLEHLENPINVLLTISRCLRRGGMFYADVPNGGRVYADSRYYDVYLEHINYWSINALSKAVGLAGLRIIETKEIHNGNHISIIAVKDEEHYPFEQIRIDQQDRLVSAVEDCNAFSVWGCGVKGSVFVRGLSNHKLKYFFDSDKRLEGLYVDDFDVPVSAPDTRKINENDLIIITATEHKATIEQDLREKYSYFGTIYFIDEM